MSFIRLSVFDLSVIWLSVSKQIVMLLWLNVRRQSVIMIRVFALMINTLSVIRLSVIGLIAVAPDKSTVPSVCFLLPHVLH